MLRYVMGLVIYLFSQIIFAGTMVVYPLTGADAPPQNQPRQTSTLGNISRVQPNPWNDFFGKLRSCTPSTTTLPQIDPVLINKYGNVVTEEIIEFKDNLCHVKVTMKPVNSLNEYKQDCNFSATTINLLIARYTNLMNNANPSYNTDENAYNQAMQKECKDL